MAMSPVPINKSLTRPHTHIYMLSCRVGAWWLLPGPLISIHLKQPPGQSGANPHTPAAPPSLAPDTSHSLFSCMLYEWLTGGCYDCSRETPLVNHNTRTHTHTQVHHPETCRHRDTPAPSFVRMQSPKMQNPVCVG